MNLKLETLKFDEAGLIPAIVQDVNTREILMLAYMNRDSLQKTLESQETWFWSRSRNQLWHKGETSGNTQQVVEVVPDCDGDALKVVVIPRGPACHNGTTSCFVSEDHDPSSHSDRKVAVDLEELYEVIKDRQAKRPEGSYTTYLFDKGLDKILKKVGEESAETIIAAKNNDKSALVSETSDLLYHLLVMLVERNVSLADVRLELSHRRGKSKDNS